jgi:hypothetical protein
VPSACRDELREKKREEGWRDLSRERGGAAPGEERVGWCHPRERITSEPPFFSSALWYFWLYTLNKS